MTTTDMRAAPIGRHLVSDVGLLVGLDATGAVHGSRHRQARGQLTVGSSHGMHLESSRSPR